jgi:hypothetical protein
MEGWERRGTMEEVNKWTLDPWASFPPNVLECFGLGEEERALKNGEISDVRNPSSLGKRGTLYSAPPNLPVTDRKTQPGTSGHARNFRPPEPPEGPELPGSLRPDVWKLSV